MSTRMGRDKATLVVDGSAMAARVAAAMHAGGCDRVAAIGGDLVALAALGLDVVPDGRPGEGPLGGILTAFDAFPAADVLLVASCDLPWLTGEAVGDVLSGVGGHDVAIAVGDRPEPPPGGVARIVRRPGPLGVRRGGAGRPSRPGRLGRRRGGGRSRLRAKREHSRRSARGTRGHEG